MSTRWDIPKERVKKQLESVLLLDGIYVSGTKDLDNIVELQYNQVFRKEMAASVQQCLLDIEEE